MNNIMQEMQARQQEEKMVQTLITADYKTSLFPLQDNDKDWLATAANAFQYTSPAKIGLSPDEFIELVVAAETGKGITIFQMGALCNNIEAITPKEMCLTLKGYLDLLQQTAGIAQRWNEQAQAIIDKHNATLKQDREMRATSLAAKQSGMGIVKAEA